MQLIKAGKEGVFYQAGMSRGPCKGHATFTCKISKRGGPDGFGSHREAPTGLGTSLPPGVRHKGVETEVSIMKKLLRHENILQ